MEDGVTQTPMIQDLQRSHGINKMTKSILEGTLETTNALTSDQAAWFKAIERTEREKSGRSLGGVDYSPDIPKDF